MAEHAIHKFEQVIRQTLAVHGYLDEFAVIAVEGRPVPIKNVDVNVVGAELPADSLLE